MSNTREQILDVASRLIHLRGFNHTSIDDILRACGIGKGNFYYYFKSKDELGFASLDRNFEQIKRELIEKSFAPGRDPWDQLQDFLEYPVVRAQQSGCAGGCPLGNLALEMSDIHEGFRQRLQAAFAELLGHLEACLERAKAAGTMREDADVPRLARFLLAGFEGALLMGKLHQDPGVLAGIIDELKQHLGHYRAAAAAGSPR
jgi:TetR/AcrR family transcriptional repressor of nem operon